MEVSNGSSKNIYHGWPVEEEEWEEASTETTIAMPTTKERKVFKKTKDASR